MTTLTQGFEQLEFLLSEAKGTRSRDAVTVTIAGAVALPSGTVMGKVTATGKYVKYDEAGTDDGRRVAAGVLGYALPGTNGDVLKQLVFTSDCEVIADRLTGLDTNGRADLLALGIKCR
jgi:hypothetical protein